MDYDIINRGFREQSSFLDLVEILIALTFLLLTAFIADILLYVSYYTCSIYTEDASLPSGMRYYLK